MNCQNEQQGWGRARAQPLCNWLESDPKCLTECLQSLVPRKQALNRGKTSLQTPSGRRSGCPEVDSGPRAALKYPERGGWLNPLGIIHYTQSRLSGEIGCCGGRARSCGNQPTITPAVLPGCASAVGRAAHTSQKGITCGGQGGAFTAHHPDKFHLGTPGSTRPQGKWQNGSKVWSLFPQTTAGPSGKEAPREPTPGLPSVPTFPVWDASPEQPIR